MDGSRYILSVRGQGQMVVNIFWLVVDGGGYILADGEWWWIVVGSGGQLWVVVGDLKWGQILV